MSFNFDTFTSNAHNCTSKAEYLLLVASESAIRSNLSESGSTYEKYYFIPVDNDKEQYDANSICFCSECESTIQDESEPCEDCFPHDEEDDYNDL